MSFPKLSLNKFLIFGALFLFLAAAFTSGAIADRFFGRKSLSNPAVNQKIVTEESIVIDVVEKFSPSVVTVSIVVPKRRVLDFNPFGGGFSSRIEGGNPQDIGSGFIVSKDGLIVTNKHVVSNKTAKYKVITKDNKEYEVKEINRDPANDLAVLKIDPPSASGGQILQPLELGSSDNLKVGQFVIAIGTALGEFRHTVTTGVISGLGRGISAGSPFEGYVERLDDVIQTDAAINPGNSGGPLINSHGQVIGINVAVAQGAQNIGFALPVNVLKKALDQFKTSGHFAGKAFLGVQYQMVSRNAAVANDIPQGAYVMDVVGGSPAEKTQIKVDDIITKIDGVILTDKNALSDIIAKKNVGDKVILHVWRDSTEMDVTVVLSDSSASQ